MNRLIAIVLFPVVFSSASLAQEPAELSVPFIFGYDVYAAGASANVKWLSNGDLLFHEPTRAGFRQGIKRLNPNTGKVITSLSIKGRCLVHEQDRPKGRNHLVPCRT